MEPKTDQNTLLAMIAREGTTVQYRKGKILFSQGDPADAVYAIQTGKVKLSVLSKLDKMAVIAILTAGDLVGEGSLVGRLSKRMSTATAITDCSIVRMARPAALRLLRDDPAFSLVALTYVLNRNTRIEADLVDQLFNSSEMRLARILLLLAHYGQEGEPELEIPDISQETLAGLVGTTRSRISFFMNRFRKLGLIDYNGGIKVHASLLNTVLHDKPHILLDEKRRKRQTPSPSRVGD